MLCNYVFRKGKNKDKNCLKINCKNHKISNLSLDCLPEELLHIILSYINDPKILLKLSKTCNIFYDMIENYIENILFNYDKADIFYGNCREISIYSQAELLFEVGCMRCNKPRIRKIYIPFAYRFCKDCIKEVTISNYKLEEAGISYSIYKNLLYTEVSQWNKYYGDYTFFVYLKKDVEKIIGCKINDYIERESKKIISQISLEYPDYYESEANINCQITAKNLISESPYNSYKNILDKYMKKYRGNKYFLQFYSKNQIKKSLIIKNAIENEDYKSVQKEDICLENEQFKLDNFWKICDRYDLKDKYRKLVHTYKDIKNINKEFQQDVYYNKEIKKFNIKYHENIDYCNTIIAFKRKVDELKHKIMLKKEEDRKILEKERLTRKQILEKERLERKQNNKNIQKPENSKKFMCDICNNDRKFCAVGLYDHKRVVHNIIL